MAAVVKISNKRRPAKRSAFAETLFPGDERKVSKSGERRGSKKELVPDSGKGHVEIKVLPRTNSDGPVADDEKADTQAKLDKKEDVGAQNSGNGGDEAEEGEVIGIITMEDVIEELLQVSGDRNSSS